MAAAQTGRVIAYEANRIGDYDGLRIRTAAGEISLQFPPHTAEAVRQLGAVGQTVAVQAESLGKLPGNSPSPRLRLISLQNKQTGRQLRLADLPPPSPETGKSIAIEEPLAGTWRDAEGRLVALRTTSYLIALKPHQSEPIRAVLAGVKHIRVVGYERTARGFVNRTGLRLVHPTALTINKQTFAF